MIRSALAALLALYPAAARTAEVRFFDQVAAAASWDDNLSNSDRATERVQALRLEVRAEGLHLRQFANGHILRLRHHVQLETAPSYSQLSQAMAGLGLRHDRKFGLGPYAPVLGFTAGAEGLVADETDRNGISVSAGLHGQARFSETLLFEVRQEFVRRAARGDVFDATSSESSLRMTWVPGPRWEFILEPRLRQGEVVSYAMPPRPDLLGEAGAIASLDTFGPTRTAYAIRAKSLSARLTVARGFVGGWTVSAGFEPRTTRRGNLDYSNRRWTLGAGKLL